MTQRTPARGGRRSFLARGPERALRRVTGSGRPPQACDAPSLTRLSHRLPSPGDCAIWLSNSAGLLVCTLCISCAACKKREPVAGRLPPPLLKPIVVRTACGRPPSSRDKDAPTDDFKVRVDSFADVRILRYRVAGFDKLTLRQKAAAVLPARGFAERPRHHLRPEVRAQPGDPSHARGGRRSTTRETAPRRPISALLAYAKRVWFCQRRAPPLLVQEVRARRTDGGRVRDAGARRSSRASSRSRQGETPERLVQKLTRRHLRSEARRERRQSRPQSRSRARQRQSLLRQPR